VQLSACFALLAEGHLHGVKAGEQHERPDNPAQSKSAERKANQIKPKQKKATGSKWKQTKQMLLLLRKVSK